MAIYLRNKYTGQYATGASIPKRIAYGPIEQAWDYMEDVARERAAQFLELEIIDTCATPLTPPHAPQVGRAVFLRKRGTNEYVRNASPSDVTCGPIDLALDYSKMPSTLVDRLRQFAELEAIVDPRPAAPKPIMGRVVEIRPGPYKGAPHRIEIEFDETDEIGMDTARRLFEGPVEIVPKGKVTK